MLSHDDHEVAELANATNSEGLARLDDEQWWQEVERAIDADGDDVHIFDREPTIVDLITHERGTSRRRINAKRPALPHEVETRPTKRKRPG